MLSIVLNLMATTTLAQSTDDRRKTLALPDSAKNDYEEWLRNEPLKKAPQDSSVLRPMISGNILIDPKELMPKRPQVSVEIMTPKLRNDMQLAAQSHWLEEQRKAQIGGAMTIGVNPLCLLGWIVEKIMPKRKSKKQRQKERLKQVLDNY